MAKATPPPSMPRGGTFSVLDLSTKEPAKHDPPAKYCVLCRHSRCTLWTHRDYTRRQQNADNYCFICKHTRCTVKSHQNVRRKAKKPVARLHQLDEEKVDPFAKHPIDMSRDLQRLYHQCWARWSAGFMAPERHLFPYSRFGLVFKSAWEDKAVHLAMLSIVAMQTSMMRDGTADELALSLQVQTITAQRNAIKSGDMSDARIMTALVIMSNAFAINRGDDLTEHMALIGQLIQQRGGLQYLGMNGLLADNLQYADHSAAVHKNIMPKYAMPLPALKHHMLTMTGPAYTELYIRGRIDKDVAEAGSSFLTCAAIFDRAARGSCSSSEARYFAYLTSVLEYQLACANATYNDTATLSECVTLGLLLGNHVLFRNYGQLSPIVAYLEARFWKCFDALRAKNAFADVCVRDLECWLACTGGLSAIRKPGPVRERAASVLTDIKSNKFRSLTFPELCNILEKYGWSENSCLTFFVKLWGATNQEVKQEEVD